MPSIKPVVKKGVVNSDQKANIKIRISHGRKVRYIKTPYYIDPKFMGSDGLIRPSYPGQSNLNRALSALVLQYNNIIADTGPEISDMDIGSIVKKLRGQTGHGSTFSSYMMHRIDELKKENRFSYAGSYQVTLDHIISHTGREDIHFREITIPFLNDFKGYLTGVRKMRINTIRIYLNNIRAVFYHAIDSEIVKGDISPFRKFKIEQEKTKPRPLDVKELGALLALRDKVTRQQRRTLDIFFLSFYLCGTNLKDLLFMKPENIVKGRIEYNRFKTGRGYSIKIFPCAREIIDRYPGNKYLLSFMDEKEKISPKRMGEAHHDVLSQVNKLLKKIKKDHNLPFHLSTYDARYSWATIASGIGISRDVIAHALGHGINTMTDLYIDFDQDKVDQANQKVISYLFQAI
jgi:integrase